MKCVACWLAHEPFVRKAAAEMRLNEIILEDYGRSLQVDLDSILAASVGRGHEEVDAGRLTELLGKMGYGVTPENLETLLSSSPFVVSSDGGTVKLKTGEPQGRAPEPVDTESAVEKMALKASEKSKGI